MIAQLLLAIVLTLQAAPPPPPPVTANVVAVEQLDGKTMVSIGVGQASTVRPGWIGVLRDAQGVVLHGSEFTVFKVRRGVAYAKVRLTPDGVKSAVDAVLHES